MAGNQFLVFCSSNFSPEAGKQNVKHRNLYKTPPSNKLNHRQKCRDLMASKRKDRQAKLLETFRRLNNDERNNTDVQKQEIIRETMTQMFKDYDIDFNAMLDEGQEYENYLSNLQNELADDYEQLLQEQINDEILEADIDLKDSVPCFACQKFSMNFDYDLSCSFITCPACTFTFVINGHILPDQLNDRLASIMQQHGPKCRCLFKFDPLGDFHRCENLRIFCQNCNFSVMLF